MNNQAAITLLKGLEQSLDDYCELNDEGKTAFRMAITALELFGNAEQLPSAQPEKRTEKRTETHACDLIDRQAAISLPVKPKEDRYFQTQNLDDAYDYGWYSLQRCIEKLPSAQPEIIYCKDCKWKQGAECVRFADVRPFPSDFCSRAERREE